MQTSSLQTRRSLSFIVVISTVNFFLSVIGCGEPVKELTPPKSSTSTPIKTDNTVTPLKSKNEVTVAPQPVLPLDPLRSQPDLKPDERILIVVNGTERYISEKTAARFGYSIVNFRDDWTPTIFDEYKAKDGEILPQSYRQIFIGLANDIGNNEGQPLEKGEFNFLEVFGVPPSLSVLWKRFNRENTEECYRNIDYEAILAAKSIRFGSRNSQKKRRKRVKKAELSVERAMEKLAVDSYADLLKLKPRYKSEVKLLKKYQVNRDALLNIERRLECDLHTHPRYRHKKGRLDQGLRLAIRRFQRKHKLYEYANLKSDTITALATPASQANFNSLVRSISERVISAAGIFEDGTVNKRKKVPTYTGVDGKKHEVRNLVKEFTDATLTQLNINTPEDAKKFLLRHPIEDFQWMRVGVKFPEYPEYYSSHMDLNIVVDRGDIWYSPPFDKKGKKVKQRRRRLPKFKMYTTYNDQKIQLIHWPTTIGGWRKEIAANGHEYLKYKNSDVGKRVIRKVISGPVWVPPKSTPLKSLARRRYVNGKAQNVVNYEEMGPGYLSAYGLVAGYFVIPGRKGRRDNDRGIRAHGSSDFMSILSPERFSHGCHRLKNDHAVRLYEFLLSHRNHVVQGDQKIRHERQFLYKDDIFEIRVLTRGFLFEMTPPVPVEVLEGRILSKVKKAIEGYVEIPGHKYPEGDPDESPIPDELKESAGGAEAKTPSPSSSGTEAKTSSPSSSGTEAKTPSPSSTQPSPSPTKPTTPPPPTSP